MKFIPADPMAFAELNSEDRVHVQFASSLQHADPSKRGRDPARRHPWHHHVSLRTAGLRHAAYRQRSSRQARTGVVKGKRLSVRVDIGGRSTFQKNKQTKNNLN